MSDDKPKTEAETYEGLLKDLQEKMGLRFSEGNQPEFAERWVEVEHRSASGKIYKRRERRRVLVALPKRKPPPWLTPKPEGSK